MNLFRKQKYLNKDQTKNYKLDDPDYYYNVMTKAGIKQLISIRPIFFS